MDVRDCLGRARSILIRACPEPLNGRKSIVDGHRMEVRSPSISADGTVVSGSFGSRTLQEHQGPSTAANPKIKAGSIHASGFPAAKAFWPYISPATTACGWVLFPCRAVISSSSMSPISRPTPTSNRMPGYISKSICRRMADMWCFTKPRAMAITSHS
jgi:hypothetical protein